MESVFRMVLVVLLSVSALSAAQFSIERSLERAKTLVGGCGGTTEKVVESASRAVAHPMANLARAGLELGVVAGCMRLRGGCGAAAGTMEEFRKAYGY